MGTVTLPTAVHSALPAGAGRQWHISFTSPTPEGAEYLGRNHRFVAALARFLMEEALTRHGQAMACRCGVIRTRAVSRLTTVSLLRVRYLLHQPERAPLLSEEVLVVACTAGSVPGTHQWLADELETSHKRVRQAVALRVRELTVVPQLPPDVLGLLVLQPVV